MIEAEQSHRTTIEERTGRTIIRPSASVLVSGATDVIWPAHRNLNECGQSEDPLSI